MKKIIAKLMNWQAQRTGQDRFHTQEAAEHDNAEYHKQLAKQRMESERGERENKEWKPVQIPSEGEITGPAESKPEESKE